MSSCRATNAKVDSDDINAALQELATNIEYLKNKIKDLELAMKLKM